MTQDEQKKAAAAAAVAHVKNGDKVGLGTGSTANFFIEALAAKAKAENWQLQCVATSAASHQLAEKLGLSVTTLEKLPTLDVTIDGADEFDGSFRLIKGGGGAMHREKLVASSSRRMVVITDETKKVETLGKYPLPVEVSQFGVHPTAWKIERVIEHLGLKGEVKLRMKDNMPYITEMGNAILDCHLGAIPEPERLDNALNNTPGVVETGLFIGLCSDVVMATSKGIVNFKK